MSLGVMMIILTVFIAGSYYIHFCLESEIKRLRDDVGSSIYCRNQNDIKFMEIISNLQDQVKELKLTEADKKTLKKAEKIKEKLG